MNQQAQIALLAAALEEVGKMPTDWLVTNGRMTLLYQRCRYNHDMVIDSEPAVLAALCGVAYSHCAKNRVAPEPFYDKWAIPKDIGLYATEVEALAAAVRIAGKEVKP